MKWIFSWVWNKNEIEQLLFKYKHRNNIHEHEKQKNEWTAKCFLTLSQRLYLRNSNKYVVLKNFFFYFSWKNIRTQFKNDKVRIIAPTRNDVFELQDSLYSVSDIQDYIEYIIKILKHYPPIFSYQLDWK